MSGCHELVNATATRHPRLLNMSSSDRRVNLVSDTLLYLIPIRNDFHETFHQRTISAIVLDLIVA